MAKKVITDTNRGQITTEASKRKSIFSKSRTPRIFFRNWIRFINNATTSLYKSVMKERLIYTDEQVAVKRQQKTITT